MAQANKHVLMTALCYNLKKYLKFDRKNIKPMAQALQNAAFGVFKEISMVYGLHKSHL